MRQIQELHCHNCDKYVTFKIDLELNGRHVITCPNCRHEHLRYVKDGIITDRRWGSRNVPTYYTVASACDVSIYLSGPPVTVDGCSASSAYMFMREAWADAGQR